MRKVKGSSIIAIIIVVAIAVIVAIVLIKIFAKGGGNGKNESSGNTETIHITETITETIQTTDAITTKEIVYIDVTVSENKYIFNNTSYEIEQLDSLISDIESSNGKFTIRITDEYASAKAYEKLISKLDNKKIKFIKN